MNVVTALSFMVTGEWNSLRDWLIHYEGFRFATRDHLKDLKVSTV